MPTPCPRVGWLRPGREANCRCPNEWTDDDSLGAPPPPPPLHLHPDFKDTARGAAIASQLANVKRLAGAVRGFMGGLGSASPPLLRSAPPSKTSVASTSPPPESDRSGAGSPLGSPPPPPPPLPEASAGGAPSEGEETRANAHRRSSMKIKPSGLGFEQMLELAMEKEAKTSVAVRSPEEGRKKREAAAAAMEKKISRNRIRRETRDALSSGRGGRGARGRGRGRGGVAPRALQQPVTKAEARSVPNNALAVRERHRLGTASSTAKYGFQRRVAEREQKAEAAAAKS